MNRCTYWNYIGSFLYLNVDGTLYQSWRELFALFLASVDPFRCSREGRRQIHISPRQVAVCRGDVERGTAFLLALPVVLLRHELIVAFAEYQREEIWSVNFPANAANDPFARNRGRTEDRTFPLTRTLHRWNIHLSEYSKRLILTGVSAHRCFLGIAVRYDCCRNSCIYLLDAARYRLSRTFWMPPRDRQVLREMCSFVEKTELPPQRYQITLYVMANRRIAKIAVWNVS